MKHFVYFVGTITFKTKYIIQSSTPCSCLWPCHRDGDISSLKPCLRIDPGRVFLAENETASFAWQKSMLAIGCIPDEVDLVLQREPITAMKGRILWSLWLMVHGPLPLMWILALILALACIREQSWTMHTSHPRAQTVLDTSKLDSSPPTILSAGTWNGTSFPCTRKVKLKPS